MRAMIANPYDELRDGMYVTVKLPMPPNPTLF